GQVQYTKHQVDHWHTPFLLRVGGGVSKAAVCAKAVTLAAAASVVGRIIARALVVSAVAGSHAPLVIACGVIALADVLGAKAVILFLAVAAGAAAGALLVTAVAHAADEHIRQHLHRGRG